PFSLSSFFLHPSPPPPPPHSFPTRRSSDLALDGRDRGDDRRRARQGCGRARDRALPRPAAHAPALRRRRAPQVLGALRPLRPPRDRKSTRLNSSHLVISYAVFCLKKKKNNN